MNKEIKNPLIIQFIRDTPLRYDKNGRVETMISANASRNSIMIPWNTPYVQIREKVLPLVGEHDGVLLHVHDSVNRDTKGAMNKINIMMNGISGEATRKEHPALGYTTTNEPFYIINPSYADMNAAGSYAPSDNTVMGKYESYENNDAWQHHQAVVLNRLKDTMPLSDKVEKSKDGTKIYSRNHAEQLMDPKRGLGKEDLEKFWSFKQGRPLSPTLMGDDMIGMPSIKGREYEGFSIASSDGMKPLVVRSLHTMGTEGVMIPMANVNGDVAKCQVMADMTAYGTALHFRTAEGRTVAKDGLLDKKTNEYMFKFADGTDTHLKVEAVKEDNTVTFRDEKGIFNVKAKTNMIDALKERGYDVPPIIASVKAEQGGKYTWQSPGTMVGSDDTRNIVSPSKAGFIKACEPRNGSDEYVVLVVEGALKGQIVAKYADVKDKEGVCFRDKIAGDRGVIVAQVPGTAKAFIEGVDPIYEKYNVSKTYLAMDADGRENRNVAKAIHADYEHLANLNNTKVLSWDPGQKGLDDSLLAVAQGKITINGDMELVEGTPKQLFPIENTHKMTAVTLEGEDTKNQAWMIEYAEAKAKNDERQKAAQAETAAREATRAAQAEAAKNEWVQTPNDISNIQSVTVAKAADMAEAMAGTVPPSKAEARVEPTPDVDEAAAAKQPQQTASSDLQNWVSQNPAMPAIEVPEGYKASYSYNQAVDFKEGVVPSLPDGVELANVGDGKWDVAKYVADHELSTEEAHTLQAKIEKGGLNCEGDMKLTEQSFTLDNSMKLELTDDDLKIGDNNGMSV